MKDKIKAYLRLLTAAEPVFKDYENKDTLPFMLHGAYDFLVVEIVGCQVLLLCDKATLPLTPRAIGRHIELVHEKWPGAVAYVADKLPAYNRQRLLEKQIPFIVPGCQMFLPFFGAMLTENTRRQDKAFSRVSFPAQRMLLAFLNGYLRPPVILDDVRGLLGISKVTAVKVFDELEYFGLARRESIAGSKFRELKFQETGRRLWAKSEPLLFSPVGRIIGLEQLPDNFPTIAAGTTALAAKTMLDAGTRLTLAVCEKTYRTKIGALHQIPVDDAPVLLECWKYAPEFTGASGIDTLSLYLTLRENNDERIQQALGEMMGGFHW